MCFKFKYLARNKHWFKQSPGCGCPHVSLVIIWVRIIFNKKSNLSSKLNSRTEWKRGFRTTGGFLIPSTHSNCGPRGSPGHRLNLGEHLPTSTPLSSPLSLLLIVITSYLRQIWNPSRDLLPACCSRVKTRWFVSTKRPCRNPELLDPCSAGSPGDQEAHSVDLGQISATDRIWPPVGFSLSVIFWGLSKCSNKTQFITVTCSASFLFFFSHYSHSGS